jgi:hypothetical protein
LHRSVELVSLSVFYTIIHLSNMYSVRHPTPRHHFSAPVRDLGDACIWPPVGMPTRV